MLTKTHNILFYVMILVLKKLYLQLRIDLSKSKSYPNSFVISSVFLLDIRIFIFHLWHISEARAPVWKPLAWPANARLLGKRIKEHRNMAPALQTRFRQTWPREFMFCPCQCPHLRWWVARDQFCPFRTHLYLKIKGVPTWGWFSSAFVAKMQKSPQVVMEMRLFTYLMYFSLFFVSQKTTQYSGRSGLVYA